MNESTFIIQNRLREITINLERAHRLQCDANWKSDGFIPPYSSIGLILNGEGTMRVDGVEIHPSKGQLYLLPAKTNQVFFTTHNNPYQKYYCHFEARCQGGELFELLHIPFCVNANDFNTATELFTQMIEACHGNDLISSIKAKCSVLNLIAYYMECCSPESVSLVENNFDTPLGRAIAFAEQNLHQTITVQNMAEVAGYHPSHFSKLFRNRLGISPIQFIIRKRLERAIELLTTSSIPVSAIAEALGFDNQFYFCNFFKKQTGMSPSEYRNAYLRTHI